MQPTPNPTPPDDNRGIRLPLLVNGGLVLLIAGLAYAGNGGQRGEALIVLFFALVALVVANGAALLVAALTAKGRWVAGFALSIGLLLLVGLGTCGLMAAA